MMEIKQISDNWYSLYTSGGSLEYNTNVNPTAQKQDDRKPLAKVFRHIDGAKVVAIIMGKPEKEEKSFFYKDSSYEEALHLAKGFIDDYFMQLNIQFDIFNDA